MERILRRIHAGASLAATHFPGGENMFTHLCNRPFPRAILASYDSRLTIVCCLVVVLCSVVTAQPPAQLHPESELPGSTTEPGTSPDETEIPGAEAQQDADLPGEDEVAGRPDPGPGPIDGEAPILRLAYDGHTGSIISLDISDGGRTLVTAGEDKEVHVWRRTNIGDTGWMHLRTVRWPVSRGPRGRIRAARLKGDLAAFAGYGAFGSKGEIRIVNVASGDLQNTLVEAENGHMSTMLSLAWGPPGDQQQLATLDREGQLKLWKLSPTTGRWNATTLFPVDAQYYGAAKARDLQQAERRAFGAVTFLGPHYLVVPVCIDFVENKGAKWHLYQLNLTGGAHPPILNQLDQFWHVRALTATDDGRVLASCDGDGSVGIWRFNDDGTVSESANFKVSAPPLSMDMDSSGKYLLVGTRRPQATEQEQKDASLEIWDVAESPPKQVDSRELKDHVRAAVIDWQNKEVIASQGSRIFTFALDSAGKFADAEPKEVKVPAKPVLRVAFAKEKGNYKIALGWNRDEERKVKLEHVFDLTESKLMGRAPIDPNDYLDSQRTAERWRLDPSTNRLSEGDQPRGAVPLSIDLHGQTTSICTFPVPAQGNEEEGEKPNTGAVIVGTGGENGIFVYRANNADPPELLRQFRDHSGAVLSLSTSPDNRYLASAGADATVSIWNLQDIYTATNSINRWGAEFIVEGDQLIVSEAREDGPLYFRGIRRGDRLTGISWTDHAATPFEESVPEKMQQRLNDLPFDFQVVFRSSRFGRKRPDFQSLPAWRPIATLFVDEHREWAYWTPAGYYDASFNGHQNFGWQLNNLSVEQPVEYFRAAQFQKRLERPDVMRRLLAAGSLPAAMRNTVAQIGPPPAEGAIVNQIESRPKIRLLSPKPGEVIDGTTLTIKAEIEVPTGATLVNPKAFVSGVPAVRREKIDNRPDASRGLVTFKWDFRLPSDPELQLEILAATESEAIDRVLIDLERTPVEKPAVKPRLHVLAIGASEYRDPQILSLDFAAKAASDVVKLFGELSSDIYQTSSDQLVNTDATRPLWRVFAQTAAENLSKTVSPDDLVIMYLCGHGLRDRRTNQWYFVTADARYSDLMNDQYGDCIAFSDLAALSRLPCRKLAILDSCHSGAVQPLMRRDDLKSALRFLQDDLVLTITASEGDEEAAEQTEAQMGRFTAALVEALKGEAPELDRDKESVSLREVIDYVTRKVTEDSKADKMPQHPTASPDYLLRTLSLPLTARPKRGGDPVNPLGALN